MDRFGFLRVINASEDVSLAPQPQFMDMGKSGGVWAEGCDDLADWDETLQADTADEWHRSEAALEVAKDLGDLSELRKKLRDEEQIDEQVKVIQQTPYVTVGDQGDG